MEQFTTGVSDVLRSIVGVCEVPVIILLLLAVVFMVVLIGTLVGEYFTENRHFKVFLPKLVDELEQNPQDPAEVIKKSGLLLRQKKYLVELTRHPELTDEMRESLAVGLEFKERSHYDNIVKITDVTSRVAPMVGLLGTLIPLGPGIMALGQGDVELLSQSLLTAFDTTSLGLIVGGLALIVSAIRKSWYKRYMASFDAIMECVLEIEKTADPELRRAQKEAAARKREARARAAKAQTPATAPANANGDAR